MHIGWIAVAVVAGFIAACGDSDGEPEVASDGEQMEAVARGYLDSLVAGDGAQTCAHLTPDAREQIETYANASSCEDAVDGIDERAGGIDERAGDARDKLRHVEIEQVRIDGGEAEATVMSGDSSPRPATFQKDGDTWKIVAFPAGVTFQSRAHAECVTDGLNEFDEGVVDGPFWQREGRESFREYVDETCRRADDQGVLEGGSEAEIQRIAARVILRMVQRGENRDPRG